MINQFKFIWVVTLLFLGVFISNGLSIAQNQDEAGEIFGTAVSKGNYYFLMKTVLSFQSPWGSIPRNVEQFEKRVWDEIILSYEAHKREIKVNQKEVGERITQTLKGHGASFDWKTDLQAYTQWSNEILNLPVDGFESQMSHLVQINKLHKQVLENVSLSVTDQEAHEEFLNEQNSLSVELAEFTNLKDAQEFYGKIKDNPDFWDETMKEDTKLIPEDRSFRKPGFVTLEFLMSMWKFPREAVYSMIEMEKGDFYMPQPIYEGYGVFKILDIGLAQEEKFEPRKQYYIDQLKNRKRHQGFKDWLDQLRQNAQVQSFIEPPYELFSN